MKLGTFIVAALCAASAPRASAAPNTGFVERASARSAARDHVGAIELYRKAYEVDSNPHLLTLIADEYRFLGKKTEALDYYCSYMYVAAAGDDADSASMHARELARQLGRSSGSDHDACSKAAPPQQVSVTGVDAIGTTLPTHPPRISGAEIVGLSLLGVGIGGLGAALNEGREVARVRGAQLVNDPTVDKDALQAQAESHLLHQKLWLAGGGVTLVTGGLLYVIGRNYRHKAERAMIAPTASKNSAGVVVGRSF